MAGRARPSVADALDSAKLRLEESREQLSSLLSVSPPEAGAEVLAMTAGSVVAALEAMRDALGMAASAADVLGDERRSEAPVLLEVDSERVGPLLRLRLRGRLDRSSVSAFASAFTTSVTATPGGIEVDCSDLEAVDVDGARVLVFARRGLGERYPFRVLVRDGHALAVLELAGLDARSIYVLDALPGLSAAPRDAVEPEREQ